MTDKNWEDLSANLTIQSVEICHANECHLSDDHKCESYAYITRDGLLDVCAPDYFQGTSRPHAAISLPWTGTGPELKEQVMEQCHEMDDGEGEEQD